MDKSEIWDASASWNGYVYQGKVAVDVVIDKICQLKKHGELTKLDKYFLELEYLEDFSIMYEDNYESIHQVKNKEDKKLKYYAEALSGLVCKIGINDCKIKGYLHVRKKIEFDNWTREIESILDTYTPKSLKEKENILKSSEEIKEKKEEMVKKFNDNKFNLRTSDLNKSIIRYLGPLVENEGKEAISIDNIKIALEQAMKNEEDVKNYLNEYSDILNNVVLYKYDNGNEFIDTKELYEEIKDKIRDYWGDDTAAYREQAIDIYLNELFSVVNKHIVDRAEKNESTRKISLSKFKKILDSNLSEYRTGEQKIIEYKMLLDKRRDCFCSNKYCEDENKELCSTCDVNNIVDYILNCSLLKTEAIFRFLAIHKTKELLDTGEQLLEENTLDDPFMLGLSQVKEKCLNNGFRMIYKGQDEYYMLTTLSTGTRKNKKKEVKIISDIQYDTVVRKKSIDILENENNDICLMEVNKLITADMDIDDIQTYVKVTAEGTEDDMKKDYRKITKSKKVGLISLNNVKLELGDILDE